MINVSLKWQPSRWDRLKGRRPNVLAIFSFRYDQHLVPELIANIEPMVDGWIAYDDRSSTELFSNEPLRRRALIEKAYELRARWILAVDPDERFERGLANRMRELTQASAPTAYVFDVREMYAPDRYRIDGIWGTKKQSRLMSLQADMTYDLPELHSQWHKVLPRCRLIETGLNLYHLKMIARGRREGRRDLYNALDPDKSHQRMGYNYLADDEGAVLETIPAGREYDPPHEDDGGLWMPEAKARS